MTQIIFFDKVYGEVLIKVVAARDRMEDEMKNKIWMCFIILVVVIINISCNNNIESNSISSKNSLNGNLEDSLEDNIGDDSEYTEEYFVEKYSIYRNPIDKYFWPKIYSWDSSQVEIRNAQRAYKKAWKTEYQNLIKWLKKKCVYDEDKKNLSLLEKNISSQINIEKKVMKTDLINAYEVNPDSSWEKNNISRSSLVGNGTQDRLAQSEGELYRDVCMRILNIRGYEEYDFKFHETN